MAKKFKKLEITIVPKAGKDYFNQSVEWEEGAKIYGTARQLFGDNFLWYFDGAKIKSFKITPYKEIKRRK